LAGTRAQSCDRYGSGTLHPGQVLGDSLTLLSSPPSNTLNKMKLIHQKMHYLLNLNCKICIKIHFDYAATCFGLRPSSESLHWSLAKVIFKLYFTRWCGRMLTHHSVKYRVTIKEIDTFNVVLKWNY